MRLVGGGLRWTMIVHSGVYVKGRGVASRRGMGRSSADL